METFTDDGMDTENNKRTLFGQSFSFLTNFKRTYQVTLLLVITIWLFPPPHLKECLVYMCEIGCCQYNLSLVIFQANFQ